LRDDPQALVTRDRGGLSPTSGIASRLPKSCDRMSTPGFAASRGRQYGTRHASANGDSQHESQVAWSASQFGQSTAAVLSTWIPKATAPVTKMSTSARNAPLDLGHIADIRALASLSPLWLRPVEQASILGALWWAEVSYAKSRPWPQSTKNIRTDHQRLHRGPLRRPPSRRGRVVWVGVQSGGRAFGTRPGSGFLAPPTSSLAPPS